MEANWRSSECLTDDEREQITSILETTMNQLKLLKCLKGEADCDENTTSDKERRTVDFLLSSLLTVTKEVKAKGTFETLTELVAVERSNCDELVTLKEQIRSRKRRCKVLKKSLNQDKERLLNEFRFKDGIIKEQSIELERLIEQNEEELEFTDELLRVQIEENELKCKLKEKHLKEKITSVDEGIRLENRVHDEVLFYYDKEVKRLNALIAHWKDRNKDIEERKLLLKSLLEIQREQHEELQFYVSLFKSRESEIQEYLDDKERRHKEKEYEIYLNTMATKLQAWWRGVMVRRCLGPFKHLLKIKNAKKRKMSLRKVNRK